ncbi:hypothetical protein ACKKBG_A17905 [Auxenochlorella protothecoides x Auxenochlorella symbiontica]
MILEFIGIRDALLSGRARYVALQESYLNSSTTFTIGGYTRVRSQYRYLKQEYLIPLGVSIHQASDLDRIGSLHPTVPGRPLLVARHATILSHQHLPRTLNRKVEVGRVVGQACGRVWKARAAASRAAECYEAWDSLLTPGCAHVHLLACDQIQDTYVVERYASLLPPSELTACGTAQEQAVRDQRIVSRGLLRETLALYLPDCTSGRELRLARGPHGKPCLAPDGHHEPSALHFNASNTVHTMGVAVAQGGEVGLDLEACGRLARNDPLSFARRRFSPLEAEAMQGCTSEAERRALFIRLWVLKEAYLKARGTGIAGSSGLRSFAFGIEDRAGSPAHISLRPDPARPDGDWTFWLLEPWHGVLSALCMSSGVSEHGPEGAGLRLWAMDAEGARRGCRPARMIACGRHTAQPSWEDGPTQARSRL